MEMFRQYVFYAREPFSIALLQDTPSSMAYFHASVITFLTTFEPAHHIAV